MITSLEHITLTTGGWRTSPRSEVSDTAIDAVRAGMAEDREVAGSGWRVRLVPGGPDGVHVFDLLHRGRRMVACWLCIDESHTDMLWRYARQAAGPGARLSRPDRVPWLAAAIVPEDISALLREPTVIAEAGDLERVVAWALIE